ncbi:MAG TPA: hypothetical protein PKD19_02785 [Candidatus Saccharibacteria bacterium]|jgi:hypothetical protein|nr:hypothetical protein [Candidatus Saccharibacteria bacterium]HMR38488.1 hypothetical protein [Candidatus Saccharibacteria bacterium]
MSSKKEPLRWFEKWRQVKTWQLLALMVLFFYISATFLRLNNVGMDERRSAVVSADKVGDADVIQNRLYDLQQYSLSHMNATTGDIYLKYKYGRDVEVLVKEVEESNKPYKNIFKESDTICKGRFYGYSQEYVQCVNSELAKYPSMKNPITDIAFPNPDLYKHSFLSPLWSFDFAGISVLVLFVLIIAVVVKIITSVVLIIMLKRQYRQV